MNHHITKRNTVKCVSFNITQPLSHKRNTIFPQQCVKRAYFQVSLLLRGHSVHLMLTDYG